MTSPTPGLRAVLFDRDNTLSFTDASVYREAAGWLAERWQKSPGTMLQIMVQHWQEQSDGWWHLTSLAEEEAYWQEYASALSQRLGLPMQAAAELVDEYPYHRFFKPMPEAREVLSELKSRGLKLGVLSNTLPSIEPSLEAIGLADLVDVPLATCLMGCHKPEPRCFTQAAQALELAPEQVLFVDDLAANVEAARGVGMQAALIDHTGKAAGAIHSLREVLALV